MANASGSKSSRDLALENNIYTYDDPRLSSTILGFSPESKRAKLLDGILDINFKKNDSHNGIKPILKDTTININIAIRFGMS